ncbi:hypothetical protein QUF75_11075 [Desulfococcaceae bacterium HSG7]|nr:hypothetical protein [Desulfococcaceae bacterium HSG7]
MFISAIKTGVLITVFVMITAVFFPNAQAEEQTSGQAIEVLGTAAITGKDVAKARELAIANALTASVARIVSEHLPKEILIKEFKQLNEKIFGHTDQYVDNYKVLTEALGGKMYRVMVQATVATPKIHGKLSDLKLLNKPTDLPKILILLSRSEPAAESKSDESAVDTQLSEHFVTDLIARQFAEKNMKVIGADELAKMAKPEDSKTPSVLTDATAVKFGQRMQADIVITGKYSALLAPNTMGADVRSFKSVVNLRALRTDSGTLIASSEQAKVTVSDDENAGRKKALTDASVLAGKILAAQIVSAWTDDSSQPDTSPAKTVEIVVEGTGSLSNFVMFRRVLSELPGVEEIKIKEMQADEAAITVRFQGDGKKLADSLMMKSYETFGIDIFEVTPQKIKVELIPG